MKLLLAPLLVQLHRLIYLVLTWRFFLYWLHIHRIAVLSGSVIFIASWSVSLVGALLTFVRRPTARILLFTFDILIPGVIYTGMAIMLSRANSLRAAIGMGLYVLSIPILLGASLYWEPAAASFFNKRAS